MKKTFLLLFSLLCLFLVGCDASTNQPSGEEKEAQAQEQLQSQAVSSVGMPAVTNFFRKKMYKQIIEDCDDPHLITYTYLENAYPQVIHGKTALGGKLTYYGKTIGYGIPAATQYTNPQHLEYPFIRGYTSVISMPMPDPDGLYSPADSEATWILSVGADGKIHADYIEPRILVRRTMLPFD